MLESITHRLQILFVILGHGYVGLGYVHLGGDAAGAFTRQSISGQAASDNTLAGETGDVRDTGEGSAILANRREGRQREHASTT